MRVARGARCIGSSSMAADELLIALVLQGTVEQLGRGGIGLAGSIDGALDLLFASNALPDAASFDVNLRESGVTPATRACHDGHVPFALVTGYGRLVFEETVLQSAPRVRKPLDSPTLCRVLAELLGATSER